MQTLHSKFDPSALGSAEKVYKTILQTQPDNTSTRLSLTWCLFVQFVHASGAESVHSVAPNAVIPDASPITDTDARRNSDVLLREFFRQISIVKHLCVRKSDCVDATVLDELIRLTGLEDSARIAEEQCLVRLQDLSSEIMDCGSESK